MDDGSTLFTALKKRFVGVGDACKSHRIRFVAVVVVSSGVGDAKGLGATKKSGGKKVSTEERVSELVVGVVLRRSRRTSSMACSW